MVTFAALTGIVCSALFFGSSSALASNPTWWSDAATRILDPASPQPANYAPVNVGQIKHVAAMARKYLDTALASVGGAGPAIDSMVDSFVTQQGSTDPDANYTLANLGQIKNVAKPFYDRLIAIGYDTKANLIARGYPPGWAHDYPWIPETLQESNYVPANLGQLKMVFSFSLAGFNLSTVDADEDGMSDVWEANNGLDPHDALGDNGAYGDLDNDGVPNSAEHSGGSNPNGPRDPDDTDGDGLLDNTEGVAPRASRVVGPKDHPDPKLNLLLIY